MIKLCGTDKNYEINSRDLRKCFEARVQENKYKIPMNTQGINNA